MAFEILGINQEVVDKSFTKSVSRIGGLSYDDIAQEALQKHHKAYHSNSNGNVLPVGGVYQWRKSGEYHLFNPETIHLLQRSTQNNDYQVYKKYAQLVNDQTKKAATTRISAPWTRRPGARSGSGASVWSSRSSSYSST